VNEELVLQLEDLPTAPTAREALARGFAVLVPDVETAMRICDRIAPEHLELHMDDADTDAWRFGHYGGLFIGPGAAEVIGDYGAGPNHVLPTGGTARHAGGLSVLAFLRVRTWISIEDLPLAGPLFEDAERLAELEGLVAHARAARWRL
jgi:histidinol dehydrogenase